MFPKSLILLEVKHSQSGGPYASRTSMGWVVNGRLGCYHKGSRTTSFFIKADPEFHQMVKDFYDSGFSKSSADNKPEMSQEELRRDWLTACSTFTLGVKKSDYPPERGTRDQIDN